MLGDDEIIYCLTTRIMEYQSSHDFYGLSTEILALLSSCIVEKRVRFIIFQLKIFRVSFCFNIFDILIRWDDSLTTGLFQSSRFDHFWNEFENSFVSLCSHYISLESWVSTNLIQDMLSLLYTISSCAIRCGETDLERYPFLT